MWCSAWAGAFPTVPCRPLRHDDRWWLGQIAADMAKYQDGDPVEFIRWTIANWSTLMRERFRWMGRRPGTKPAPVFPEVWLIHHERCRGVLLQAWQVATTANSEAEAAKRARVTTPDGRIRAAAPIQFGRHNPHPNSPRMRERQRQIAPAPMKNYFDGPEPPPWET